MTARELYEYALIECNKLEAPSLLLEDYNYFINKAVQQYINTIYNRYDVNQQSTDDLRVLKTSTVVTLQSSDIVGNIGLYKGTDLFGKSYIGELPKDYLHMLNCIVEYNPQKRFKCYEVGDPVQFAARRLTSDMFAGILNNAYMRPMYKRPYYYINNFNEQNPGLATNDEMDKQIKGNASEFTEDDKDSTVDSTKPTQGRNANVTKILLEIRFGKDDSLFTPTKAYIDYLKAPQYIRLTQAQIDKTEDTSQILEFPDYVCFEIVNIFTRLLLENSSDPRLQTNLPINNTIATGVPQQQAPQQQGQ